MISSVQDQHDDGDVDDLTPVNVNRDARTEMYSVVEA